MKSSIRNKSTKQAVWSALKAGVFGAILTGLLASTGTFAQEAPQKPSVSPEQQKRLEAMKAKGTEGSLTVLPVRIGGECWDRLTEVVGTFFEKQGLKNIELGKAEFKPVAKLDMEPLAASLGEFVKKNPIATDYALYTEFNGTSPHELVELRAVVVDKAGALVWTDRQTPQDKAFKRRQASNAMTMSILLCDRLGPQLGLNEQTRKAAKPGKLAAIMAERGGQPPENETAPLPGRQQAMKQALPHATLVVFSPRVRVADKVTEAGNATDLAKAINDAGLCKAEPAKQSVLLKAPQEDPNEAKVMWDLAREFRDYVKKNPTDADYVLYADYRFNPEHWEQGFVHLIVCDRNGEWVITALQNSHHPNYQSIKPTSKADCDKILVKLLTDCLRAEPPAPAFKQTKEWKALNRLVGDWEVQETVTVPETKQGRGSRTATWTLGDRYLVIKGKSGLDNSEWMALATYDPDRQAIREWVFSSLWAPGILSVRWDEQTNTFTFKGEDAGPTTVTGTDHFLDEDHHELTLTVKDGSGKVLFASTAKITRQKK